MPPVPGNFLILVGIPRSEAVRGETYMHIHTHTYTLIRTHMHMHTEGLER